MKNLNDLKNFDALKIYIASPEEMLDWSFGEVTKPETINYRTFKAEREGLFDERIFGPAKNFECYCGKYKGIRYRGVICDKCGVEVTNSRVRRERMGHITLACPVSHIWFFKGIPSKMAILLDISPRNLETVIYFSSYIVTKLNVDKRAGVISQIQEDLVASTKRIEKEIEGQIHDFEKELAVLAKSHDELKAKEEEIKLKQKIQTLRNTIAKKLEENEKMYQILSKKIEGIDLHSIISDAEYLSMADYVDAFCTVEMGAEAIRKILGEVDLNALSAELKELISTSKGQKATKYEKRHKVVEQFRKSGQSPERMIISILPVIPPDLRPLVQLEGGRFASSDLNELYRRVINRNNRLKRLLDLGAPEIIVRNEKRMLQESVDALFDSSKQRVKNTNKRGNKELRSLTDMLKGKTGIFRLNLLGKRVDYSGRGVIINGPNLKLHECGLPKEMALELFKPFVLRELLAKGFAPNVKSAKFVLDSKGKEVWDILEDVVKDHPVLLNRAPTLWRLGIQAFYPKLIEGNAIRLHLCVCAGYNADFDGDQMAVHVPLTDQAVEEARTILLSSRNLLNPSNGSPMSVPSKIILFGTYFMTSLDDKIPEFKSTLSNAAELLYLYESDVIKLRQRVHVVMNGTLIETSAGRVIFNSILPSEHFEFINDAVDKTKINGILARAFEIDHRGLTVRLIDDIKDLGLKYGTMSGHSISLFDVIVPANRNEIIQRGKDTVAEINKNYRRGLITKSEAQRLTEQSWLDATAKMDEAVWNALPADSPVKELIKSKATRASQDQLKQIAGMKGLVSDTSGRTVQIPILGNYRYGLSGLEYFLSSRGARKTLVDKGLKTADAGYLTRRLCDVAQDVLVREEDCGTSNGRELKLNETTLLQSFDDKAIGRYLLRDVKAGGKTVVKKDTLLTRHDVESIKKLGVESIFIRSALTCQTKRGVCIKCYGVDMITKELITMGSAVGISAAQSIGEPGTQLTMRTFHTGGIVGKDITQGLPRVEELVEARAPKFLAIMSEITGTVQVVKNGDDRKIMVFAAEKDADPNVIEYQIDPVAEIIVKNDQVVSKGERLTSGHLDLPDLMRTIGIEATQKYIIEEVQKVYASQGVALNDKHIEVIVKQMFNYVKIENTGDTEFSSGDIVSKAAFEDVNEKVLAEGGAPAVAKIMLLGITRSALYSDSFLSAASFQMTSNVLTDAAASGKIDQLLGLKENVIIGRLIPTNEKARL